MRIPFLPLPKRKRTISFVDLWDNTISSILEKDDSTTGVVKRKPFYMDMKGFYSDTDNVTFVYSIDAFPAEMQISFRSTIRRECKDGVRVTFLTKMDKYQIHWNSAQVRSKLRTWRALDSETEGVDAFNLHENIDLMDSQERKKASIVYFNESEKRRKRKLFKVSCLMLVSGKRGDDFNASIVDINKACVDMGLKANRVMLDIEDYLEVFSPFSCGFNSRINKQVGSVTLTDEILARLNTYSQGKIGVRGTYWGTDIFSGFPCLKITKKTTETAENWLITAETGGGKSYLIKGLILQLLGNKRINGTIMDVEGFEYIPIAKYIQDYARRNNLPLDVVVLNMGEGVGAYFDPVPIVVTGNKDLDKDMFGLSNSYTVALFKTLAGTASNNEWVDISITNAVTSTYTKAGVDVDSPSTWKKSEHLSILDVYNELKAIKPINDEHRLALDLVLAKVGRYFDKSNPLSKLFKQRISISEIAYAKLVVCSFGMAGKSETNVDPVQMALMQLTASIISHIRSIFSKLVGKFNFKLWEEFQRWGKFPNSEKTIGTALTGGRKLGDINIIATNEVGKILDDDKFGLFSNLTSIAIGCIGDSKVREELCKRLSIPNMLPELDKLVKENKDLSDYTDGDNFLSNIYSKAFLIGLDKSVYTLSRMVIPEEISKSDIFRTGINDMQEVAS